MDQQLPKSQASLPSQQIQKLQDKVQSAALPEDLLERAQGMVSRLKLIEHEANFILEYDSASRYLDWICTLPWNKTTQDILDLAHAKQVLDKNHLGLTDVKNKILEYLSSMIMKTTRGIESGFSRAPIISLVGLAGVGKTTFAYSIAEALGRRIQRIPFGGMGAAGMLRGQSRFSPEAEPGLVIKAIRRAGVRNPVILLDEIDRVSEYARADIMGVLVELLDPEQNRYFTDHYIDYPFDLSQVLFVATSNNTKDISTAVLDRLEIVQMPSYTDAEKVDIAKHYVLPEALREAGLTPQEVTVGDDAWAAMIRTTGYDPGIRSVKRIVDGFSRKIARRVLEGKIPPNQPFAITTANMKEFVTDW